MSTVCDSPRKKENSRPDLHLFSPTCSFSLCCFKTDKGSSLERYLHISPSASHPVFSKREIDLLHPLYREENTHPPVAPHHPIPILSVVAAGIVLLLKISSC